MPMINPTSDSEKLLFSTVRLEVEKAEGSATGTGFFFKVAVEGARVEYFIVTNKHVVKGGRMGRFVLHDAVSGVEPAAPADGVTPIIVQDFEAQWTGHPSPHVDLCAMPFVREPREMSALGKVPFLSPFSPSLIPSEGQLAELGAVEDVLMVGYPNGLFDLAHTLPLIRRGTTASHPAVDHGGAAEGVVDIACFPGSSGSPIVICNQGFYGEKAGGISLRSRFFLLGVLHAGPVIDADGQISIREVPTVQRAIATTQLMMHLGYYVKAREILTLAKLILGQTR